MKQHNLLKCNYCGSENYFKNEIQHVYISDSDKTDLLKIGMSARDPQERIKEFSRATSSVNWNLAVYYKTLSSVDLEKAIFNILNSYRYESKEMFEIDLYKVIEIINDALGILPNHLRKDLEFIKEDFELPLYHRDKKVQRSKDNAVLKDSMNQRFDVNKPPK
ncbi:GIY-YIG nuclease family protein [Gracilimonas sp. Q87]|uniref:GIY-YIG nuclease family protein n=1 Tax=Gracilimonas sp. Q87 TaxID=3384766 RepID=UPI003983DCCF